jgi:polyvinyl alcohol dehydrogenase (cytochrome)
MLALNAETGAKLWSFAAGSSVVAGAAIVGGDVYWGAGSSRSTAPNRFYAFSEKGK